MQGLINKKKTHGNTFVIGLCLWDTKENINQYGILFGYLLAICPMHIYLIPTMCQAACCINSQLCVNRRLR